MIVARDEIRVTKLERGEDGHWRARVTCDGVTTAVHRRYGSWMIDEREGSLREVLPDVAAALQKRVRPKERKGE